MANTLKSKAEKMFAESDRKAKLALNEREKERQKSAAHTAELRKLRLAKEAADKLAAPPTAPRKKRAPVKKARVY